MERLIDKIEAHEREPMVAKLRRKSQFVLQMSEQTEIC